MDKRSSRDLLSDLPLSIIHTILESVPIRDVVKTSILSRQWRYTWATLPHLSFGDDSTDSSKFHLKDFITQLLFLHQGPIIKFELNVSIDKISQNINQWFLFLARKDIKKLILCFYDDLEFLLLHSSIYSCQSLNHLEIFNCEFPLPPSSFKGFSSLRRLYLELVGISSNTIQALFSDLTLLEELRLRECGRDLDLRIHAPNLKILSLNGVFKGVWLYAPLLRIISVNFQNDFAFENSLVCAFVDLLGSLTSLEELKGSLYFFKYLSIGIESCHIPLVLPRLSSIELTPMAFYDKKVEMVIAHLCMCAPNLHKIKVSYSYASDLEVGSEGLFVYSECPFKFTFARLKVIEIASVGGISRWMKLFQCLVASSPVLETLIYELPSSVKTLLTDSELRRLRSNLVRYAPSSSNVNVLM